MQSGISASAELQAAFGKFTSENSLFALPITITSEALKPLEPIPFSTDFRSSLPSLQPHLQPKTPIYLLLRRSPGIATENLVAITYVPSTAPVRSKTLFASTRATLVRDLGLEKFAETLFVTEPEEVLDQAQWDERLASKNGATDTNLLSTEERELQGVKRAEEEARHGTSGRDLMGEGGSGFSYGGGGGGGRSGSTGTVGSGIRMKVTDEAKSALGTLKDSVSSSLSATTTSSAGGPLVQLGIDLSSETLVLLTSSTEVPAHGVPAKIPTDRPSYTFYHFPGTESVIFIYTCPGTSKVKERMMYAASRNGVVDVARNEGVVVAKRLEAGEPEDITEQRLKDEAGASTENAASATVGASQRQGFARPKRPGKR